MFDKNDYWYSRMQCIRVSVFNILIRLNPPCHVEPVSVANMLSNYLLTELEPVRLQRESLKEIRWGGFVPRCCIKLWHLWFDIYWQKIVLLFLLRGIDFCPLWFLSFLRLTKIIIQGQMLSTFINSKLFTIIRKWYTKNTQP